MVTLRRPVSMTQGTTSPGGDSLRAQFGQSSATEFSGFVLDVQQPNKRFVVELWLDEVPVRLARADMYVPSLAEEGIGDACYGFSFSLPPQILGDCRMAELRLANTQKMVGEPIDLNAAAVDIEDSRGGAGAEWIGGLRFRGWVQCAPESSPLVRAVVDGQTLAQVRASGFSHTGGIENARLVKAFDLHLPRECADGRVRRVHFFTEDELQLTPAPLTFVAFPDAVEQFFAGFGEIASERLRGRMLDLLLPASVPFTSYDSWRIRWNTQPTMESEVKVAVVLVAGGDDQLSLQSLDDQRHKNWVAAALPSVQGTGSFDPLELADFLANDAGEAEMFVFASAGTNFSQDALACLADTFDRLPQASVVYSDLELAGADGYRYLLALPAFDYERMLEQGYCAHLFAMRREALKAALATDPTNLYRLLNSGMDRAGDSAGQTIAHLPLPLGSVPSIDLAVHGRLLAGAGRAHLSARGISADVAQQRGAALPLVRVTRKAKNSELTIIVPVRNRKLLLQNCLSSIAPAVNTARARLLIVDNDSSEADMIGYLGDLRRSGVQVLSVPGPFNFAQLNNLAVQACDSEQVLLLNNDIRAIDANWLDEMRSRLVESDVGAVGALLLWPSGMVQHGGVVVGPSFAACHIGNDRLASDSGYGDMLRVARQCRAVTAACLLTRRSDYLAVDGLDEIKFPVNFNDVDFCLKLQSLGRRVVWTPYARLYHDESASRGLDRTGVKAARFERELRNLRNKWGDDLVDDPYYSPSLSLDPVPFSALAWPPRDRAPRINRPTSALTLPPGF